MSLWSTLPPDEQLLIEPAADGSNPSDGGHTP